MGKIIICKKHVLEPSRFGLPVSYIDRDDVIGIELFNSGKELEYRKDGTLKDSKGVEGYTVRVKGLLPVHIFKNSEIDLEYEKRKE